MPILLRLALNGRRRRVLELEPVRRTAGAVARPQPLRDDAFHAHLAGVCKHQRAVGLLKVFIQTNARPAPAEDARQGRLANLDWFAPHVGAV
jgi:hypothetical protein